MAGRLVAREHRPQEAAQVLDVRRLVTPKRDHGGHPLAEAVVRNPDDEGVAYGRVALEDRLHFLGVDLLAAGVDARRAPAEQTDGAVGLVNREVAGDRP